MPPNIKAEPSIKLQDASTAVSSALTQSVSMGVKEEPAAALPMEVDDDTMFQRKPSKAVKPEPSEVGWTLFYYDELHACLHELHISYAKWHYCPSSFCCCIAGAGCLASQV